MIYFLLIFNFVLLIVSFILCSFMSSNQKREIELLWNCIDNNRKRLTEFEEQSNLNLKNNLTKLI